MWNECKYIPVLVFYIIPRYPEMYQIVEIQGTNKISSRFPGHPHISVKKVSSLIHPQGEKNTAISHRQYHSRWWAGEAKSQGISSHDADLGLP